MKLLFVHPGPLLYTNVFLRLEPLGLELVAEAARRRKHSVRLIDLQGESPGAYHRMISEWLSLFLVTTLLTCPRLSIWPWQRNLFCPVRSSALVVTALPSSGRRFCIMAKGPSIACLKVKARRALLSCSKLWRATLMRFQKCPAPSRQTETAPHTHSEAPL